jgi:hypothetical protein
MGGIFLTETDAGETLDEIRLLVRRVYFAKNCVSGESRVYRDNNTPFQNVKYYCPSAFKQLALVIFIRWSFNL